MGNTCQDFMPVSFLVLNVNLIANFFASKSFLSRLHISTKMLRPIRLLLQILKTVKVVRNILVKGVSYYDESLVLLFLNYKHN